MVAVEAAASGRHRSAAERSGAAAGVLHRRAEKSPAKGAIEETVTRLRAEKYPVTVHDLGPTERA